MFEQTSHNGLPPILPAEALGDHQYKRFGPLKFDWTITLSDVFTLLAAMAMVMVAYTDIRSDVRSLAERHERAEKEIVDTRAEINASKTRQEMIEQRITSRLDATVSKLDHLIGRVEASQRLNREK